MQANVRDQTTLSFVGASAEPSVPAEAFMEDTEAEADEVAEPVRVVVGARRTRAVQPHSSGRRRERRPSMRRNQIATGGHRGRQEFEQISRGRPSLTGKMAEIDALLAKGKGKAALKASLAWRHESPAELLPLVALGRSYLELGETAQAARAFGSILDLFPSRADMRRMAGNWLETCGQDGLSLAADTYRVAMEQRPDHPSVYHQLSMVLVRLGQHANAFEILEKGLQARKVANRFPGVDRILREDMTLIGQAWVAIEFTQG